MEASSLRNGSNSPNRSADRTLDRTFRVVDKVQNIVDSWFRKWVLLVIIAFL
jgi:hypothetical protein